MTAQLTPRALRTWRDSIDKVAAALVDEVVPRRDIDGVADLALPMPLTAVPDLFGWPDHGREKLLDWGIAAFDFAGPADTLFWKSLPSLIAMRIHVDRIVRRRDVAPGSAAEIVVEAFEAGTSAVRNVRPCSSIC